MFLTFLIFIAITMILTWLVVDADSFLICLLVAGTLFILWHVAAFIKTLIFG